MNYRHLYHAGNFADVFKHVVLVALLSALKRKNTPFAYFETHAGAGRYDLRRPEAQKTAEYRDGIGRVWDQPRLPEALHDYLAAVMAANAQGGLRYYPGSPRVARALLREQDRMQLAELEPGECERLRREFAHDRRVRVDCLDGYGALKGWLPPREGRGVVLIDPAYEAHSDWTTVARVLAEAWARWNNGVYALWYPIKAGVPLDRLKRDIAGHGVRKVWVAELDVWPVDTPFRLNGCGMIVVNPPWKLDQELPSLLESLSKLLAQSAQSRAHAAWWVAE